MSMLTKARAFFLGAILAVPVSAQAGSGDAQFGRFPFDTWATDSAKPQIAWEVDVAAPYLFLNQRLMTRVKVAVGNRDLLKHRDVGRMFVLSGSKTPRDTGIMPAMTPPRCRFRGPTIPAN